MIPLNELLKEYKHMDGDGFKAVMSFASRLHEKGEKHDFIVRAVEVEFGPAPVTHLPEDNTGRVLHPFGVDLIDPKAIHEMRETMKLPPVTYAALMPDAHPMGKRGSMPVGGVMACDNAVVPSAVGVDISCMVQLVITDLPVETLQERKAELADTLQEVARFGIGPDGEYKEGKRKQHEVMDRPEWDNPALGVSGYKDLAYKQLGTLGKGNHFLDLVEVDLDVHLSNGVDSGKYVGILTHFGSRGTGHKIAKDYMKIASNWFSNRSKGYPKGTGYLPLDTEAGSAYFLAMTLMGHYADAGHELVASDVLDSLSANPLFVVRSRHNFAFINQRLGWIVHRKGATPAGLNQLGLLPGSSGTPSYITMGLGNPNALNSSAHGAGRVSSRAQAKENFAQDAFDYWMNEVGVEHRGVAKDETPFAYKDITKVVAAQEGILTRTVGTMLPQVVVMGQD